MSEFYRGWRGDGTWAVASTDWEDDFRANPYFEFNVPTSGGFLIMLGESTNDPVMYTVAFDSDHDYTVNGRIHVAGANIQVKFNGVITTYAASSDVSLSVKRGTNVLKVTHDGTAGVASFDIRLYDGETARWVNPRGTYNDSNRTSR